jgi:hypothetical protein
LPWVSSSSTNCSPLRPYPKSKSNDEFFATV